MIVMTVTARYRKDPDILFAEVLDFDMLRRDLGGLVDYHGLPSGHAFEGQTYSFTPVLWTWFRFPEVHVTSLSIDATAREWRARSVSANMHEMHHLTRIVPDGDSCLWVDRYDMLGPPPGRLMRALSRHIQKAGHRRRRARDIRVKFERP
uniref:Polyketide cyclase/dehydrase/lipid transport protein n=2 Tax=Gymnodinialimonas phycosphaerae TaxID=2841589 RepID=A0A975YEK5_9RHOB